jgi:hypothetical protein
MELARSPANAKKRLLISGLSAGPRAEQRWEASSMIRSWDRLEEDFAQPDGSAGQGACGAGRRVGSGPM